MGVEINPVTGGPVVNESLETSLEGVFACGNVLHVHDLVDYVSGEAKKAGQQAAVYLQGKQEADEKQQAAAKGKRILVTAADGVRYTVPNSIDPAKMEDKLIVRFRVGKIYKGCYVSVYLDDKRLLHRKRPVMAPGEMEEIILEKQKLQALLQESAYQNGAKLTVRIEED